ncbi:MAG: DUF5618 family protein [Cyclobacteriaceae bacterium]|nr:DUF5618 family protein [Cyclobacteriaceae bacterium]
MSQKERENRYREAVRYLVNAQDILRTKAKKQNRYYEDEKYVRMACGTAYNGVLKALDTYLELKGKALKKRNARPAVKDYQKALTGLSKNVLNEFNTTYEVLHLLGYYDGNNNAVVIHQGLTAFAEILNQIKPIGTPDISLN